MKRSTGVRERKSLKVGLEQRNWVKAGLGQEYIHTYAHICVCMHRHIHIKMHYKFVQIVLCNTHEKRQHFIIQDIKGIV